MKLKMVCNSQRFYYTSSAIIINGGMIFKLHERGLQLKGFLIHYEIRIPLKHFHFLQQINTSNGGKLFIFVLSWTISFLYIDKDLI